MQEAENVRFFEPHVLCPVLWEQWARGREHAVLRAACSLSCVAGNGMRHAGRNVRLQEPHISLSCVVGLLNILVPRLTVD